MIGGKAGAIIGTALIVDAGDDLVSAVLGGGNVSGLAGGLISGRTAGAVQVI